MEKKDALDAADPKLALEEAKSAASKLDAKSLCEVKSYAKPPPPVQQVLSALAILLGRPSKEWKDLKVMMANYTSLMKAVRELSVCAPDRVKEAKKMVEGVTMDKVKMISIAAADILCYVLAMVRYFELSSRED